MNNISIRHIEYYLPETLVTNEDLQRENPSWDMNRAAEKTGVYNRHFAKENETAFDMACKACNQLFASGVVKKEEIDGIIFCTQSPDYLLPSNAFLIHKYLGLKQSVFAFDYNLACSGYIYGMAIARGFFATNLATNILLINGDTYSKFINPKDRSTRILFGDGASVSLLSKTEKDGIIDIVLESSGKDYESFYLPGGGSRIPISDESKVETTDSSGNVRTPESIHMNGFGVWKFIASTVPKQIDELLKKNGYGVSDVDLFIFHQASKMTLDSLIKALKIDDQKTFINITDIGNLVSASIPVAIKNAEEAGRLKRGDLLVLSGFGVGLSWGTIIMRY
ncbi:MAG: fabH1 [Bacteroidetes bacterium]|nr:fabH1 [Bacteroidota bacterium]